MKKKELKYLYKATRREFLYWLDKATDLTKENVRLGKEVVALKLEIENNKSIPYALRDIAQLIEKEFSYLGKPVALYCWDDVPDWVEWIATDRDFRAYGFKDTPSLHGGAWEVNSNDCDELNLTPVYNWRNSLEQRPK